MTDLLVGDATKRRIFSTSIDNVLSMFVALLVGSRLPELPNSDRVSVAVAAYLAYYLAQEGVWSTTLGKRLFGLRIYKADGSPCGWRSATIRTVTRVVEVNPILGALPAGLAVAFSKRHQRLGDMLSGCVGARERQTAQKA